MDLKSIKNRCSRLLPYTYGFFLCAFLFFPSPKSHNNLFYLTVLIPAIPLLGDQFLRLMKNNIPFRVIFLFIVYCSISVFWSPIIDFDSSLKIVRHAFYPLLFINITIHLLETNPKIFEKIFTWLIIAAVFGAALNILFWYKDNPFPSSRLFGWGRIENPIVIGCIYGMIAIITITRAIRAETKRDILIYLATTLAFLGFILLTHSKLAQITFSITLLVSVIIHFNRKAMIFLMSAALFVVLFAWRAPEVFQRYSFAKLPDRYYIWKKVLYDSMDAMFFGHGILAEMSAVASGVVHTTPHSIYVGTVFYFGIFGMLLLGVFIIWVLKISFDYGRQSKDYLVFILCIFGLIACAGDYGILIDHPNGLWVLFWLPTSLAISKYNQTKKAHPGAVR